jgi:hypothetical protein
MISDAYREVEDTLRAAVETAKSKEEFVRNLHKLQLKAQRMLALLIFNSSAQNKVARQTQTDLIYKGIENELAEIEEAALDESNMASVEASFNSELN